MGDEEIHRGDRVAWNWGRGHAEGTVTTITPHTLTKTIASKPITRHGTDSNPALYITRDKPNQNPVVKKASEVHVLQEGEDVKGCEKVETRRQREMEG
ncbi:hypothetical protein HK104_003347 [Borealophlyctis nickersoniae]|nr:hypothetical protein HK104_003347 [Borealophlyctis nickersoniae]